MEADLQQTNSPIIRVAVVGPECTGKTTLCTDLANHFRTQWVAEYMREYLQKKWDEQKKTCQWEDLLPIAKGQISAENQLVSKAKDFIFCDTNFFEIMVYSYIYYGKCPDLIEKFAQKHKYDFVFLTDVEVPWEADDLRDKPNQRQEIFDIFKDFLDRYKVSYTHLKGTRHERLQKVISILQQKNNSNTSF